MKFYVIEESPAGTVVLDREFLEPEDILYFNEEKVVIKSFGKIQLDNGWLYELEQLLSFRVGNILYDKLEFNNEDYIQEDLPSPLKLTLEGFRKQLGEIFLRNRIEVNKLFKQFLVAGECKIPNYEER